MALLEMFLEYLRLSRRRSWPSNRRQERQSRLLHRIVGRGFEIPLYNELFRRHGIAPNTVQTVADLERLPFVTKAQLQAAGSQAIFGGDSCLGGAHFGKTSGSTGHPMTIYYSEAEAVRRAARFERAQRDLGCQPWFRRLRIHVPRPHEVILRGLPRIQRILQRTVTPDEAIPVALRYRPDVIKGRVSLLQFVARRAVEAAIDCIRPRLVLTGGEMLTEEARRVILGAFRAPVRPLYASWEFGAIAAECPLTEAYHLVTDDLLIEAVADGQLVPMGIPGEAVITGLTSDLMPFLRYRLGDRIILDDTACPCGNPLIRITQIQGRSDDMLWARDGTPVPPISVIMPLATNSHILQYRINQTELGEIHIDYVSGEALEEASLQQIRQKFAQMLQAEQVTFRRVAEIPADPSGKLRKIISKFKTGSG